MSTIPIIPNPHPTIVPTFSDPSDGISRLLQQQGGSHHRRKPKSHRKKKQRSQSKPKQTLKNQLMRRLYV